jgi:2-polyprenyl-3-methyl-5-hydroxy-6-metoxy-1,4-benzoquinol methylase
MSITKCKICSSDNIEKVFKSFNTHGKHVIDMQERFQVCRCKDCSLVFLDGVVVNSEYYSKYYQEGYYRGDKVSSGPMKLFLNVLSDFSTNKKKKVILKTVDRKKDKISILDVGCGTGGFLESLEDSRFDKYGCEVSKDGFKVCISKGLSVYHGDVCDVDFKGRKFDVVTLWHVLEHTENPKKVFSRIGEILSDNGVLIFQVPNTDSLGFRIGKEYWFHMDSPRHLNLFSTRSVKKLCSLTGFKIVDVKYEFYDFPLDLFWSVRKSKFKFFIYPLYLIFKAFSREHVTFICKKK